MLVHFESLVTLREKKKGQVHKIFKDSFDAKPIFSEKFLIQKINYIHYNPVTGKWMLAKILLNMNIAAPHFTKSRL
jgi:putative transposase